MINNEEGCVYLLYRINGKMRHFVYILSILFFLPSCQKEDFVSSSQGKGNFDIGRSFCSSRKYQYGFYPAVENDLYVEIWQNGQLMSGQQYEPGKVPAKLDLPAGSYLLKTYNLAYKDMPNWVDTETGGAAFYAEKNFKIDAGKINYLNVEVPMVNIGVSLKLPEGFSDRFKDYHFTVQFGNRSAEISNGETAYFPSSEVTYILSVTNNDGENKTNSKTIKSPVAGTIYEISYGYATKGLIVNAKYGL